MSSPIKKALAVWEFRIPLLRKAEKPKITTVAVIIVTYARPPLLVSIGLMILQCLAMTASLVIIKYPMFQKVK